MQSYNRILYVFAYLLVQIALTSPTQSQQSYQINDLPFTKSTRIDMITGVPSGKHIYVADSGGKRILVINSETMEAAYSIPFAEAGPWHIALSKGSKLLLAIGAQTGVYLVELQNLVNPQFPPVPRKISFIPDILDTRSPKVAFDANDNLLVSSGSTVLWVNSATGQLIQKIFSPNNSSERGFGNNPLLATDLLGKVLYVISTSSEIYRFTIENSVATYTQKFSAASSGSGGGGGSAGGIDNDLSVSASRDEIYLATNDFYFGPDYSTPISRISSSALTKLQEYSVGSSPRSVAAGLNHILSAASKSTLFQFDLNSGGGAMYDLKVNEHFSTSPYSNGAKPRGLIISSNGQRAFVTIRQTERYGDVPCDTPTTARSAFTENIGTLICVNRVQYIIYDIIKTVYISIPIDNYPPAAPSSLNVQLQQQGNHYLSWQDNATNETSYRIEESTDGINWRVAGNKSANSDKFTIPLFHTNPYYYRVFAVNGALFSSPSNVLQYPLPPVATTTTTSTTTTLPSRPNAPSHLRITSKRKNFVALTWRDNSKNETGFILERYVVIGKKIQSGSQATYYLKQNSRSYIDRTVLPGRIYTYRLKAANGHSVFSNYISLTVSVPRR